MQSSFLTLFFLLTCMCTAALAQTPTRGSSVKPRRQPAVPDSYMSLSVTGVDSFLTAHPNYDGRGVVVLIFDTGVDMSIPGLEKTSTGQVKVIDAIDFSGSCVVNLRKATAAYDNQGGVEVSAAGLPVQLRNVGSLTPPPVDGVWYMGYIDESTYRNSSVRDFDGDNKSRSKFGVLVWHSAKGWHVSIDTDTDSSMTGEMVAGNYPVTHDYILFKQRDLNAKPPLTFAAHIDTVHKTVSFHYDMGGHGTHVAGIATGFQIQGMPGFNGVAPGAQVISCKFSGDTAKDNTITGSMRHAYEYAARLADSLAAYQTPVVVNMSFGIGSAYEGKSIMERFIDSMLPLHPNLYVVVAAGNEGPGISTIGLPASSGNIISVGALLPRAVASDMGMQINRDILWDFSSRGGEVDKPDIVTPGTAVSTVPRFAFETRESGTSMASPHATGLVALLLSAMRQEDPAWVPSQEIIRRALRASGRPLGEAQALEQGDGVANVGRAYELLKRWRSNGFGRNAMHYNISVPSAYFPDGTGSTVFQRDASAPVPESQTFTVTAVSAGGSRAGESEQTRACTLESTAGWLRPQQTSITLQANKPTPITVQYDRKKLTAPGIYSARIYARRADGEPEFSLLSTIVVPYTFSKSNNYKITAPSRTLQTGGLSRYYFTAPPGASGMWFTLSIPKKSQTSVSGQLMDRNGYEAGYMPRADGKDRPVATALSSMQELRDSSVFEAVVQAESYGNKTGAPVTMTLTAECLMADMDVKTTGHSDGTASLNATLVNTGTKDVRGEVSYFVRGYKRTVKAVMHGDTFSMPIVVRKSDGAVWVTPKFAPKEYMRSTDILAQIVDSAGNSQAGEAFNKPSERLFVPNFSRTADSTVLTLQIIFGATDYERVDPIPVEIEEWHVRPEDPIVISNMKTALKPGEQRDFQAVIPADRLNVPPGFTPGGDVLFKPAGSRQSVPFEFQVSR